MPQFANPERLRRLVYLILAFITFILLVGGLSSVEPRTGEIVFAPLEERRVDPSQLESDPAVIRQQNQRSIVSIVLTGIAAGLLIFGAFRSPKIRSWLLVGAGFLAFFLAASYVYRLLYTPPNNEADDFGDVLPPPQERISEELLNNPPDFVDWVSIMTTAGIILVAALIIWLVWRYRTLLMTGKPTLEIIATEAESALANLRAGADLKDTVMRCYFDMGQALGKQMGLVRKKGMTPREFEDALHGSGLPQESVARLTRLFERVRYGGQTANQDDIAAAVACLENIIQAARQNDETTATV